MLGLLDILTLGISSAMLIFTYITCLEEGMILEIFGNWLTSNIVWYKKILGACPYCTTPYLTGINIVLYIFAYDIWAVAFCITFAFFLIAIFDKLDL